MIKNIIFDVGKVLVSYEPQEYMKSLGIAEKDRETIFGAMFGNQYWDQMDAGILGQEEALLKFIEGAPQYESQIRQLYGTMGNTVELYPYALEWLSDLKNRGYRIYILSNYSRQMMEQTKNKLQFLSLVDGAVFSYECRMMKPEAEIYQHLCRTYDLNAAECVFVDDRMENVEGARNVGIAALQFTDYPASREQLEELLKK